MNSEVDDAILLYLRYAEPSSISDLAHEIRFHRSTVNRGVRRLERKGWVTMEKDEGNWRMRLTWEGAKQLDSVLLRTFTRLQYCRG